MNPEEHLPQPLHAALNPSALVGAQVETDRCPWCNSTITHAEFVEISARIAEKEGRRFQEEKIRIEQEARREKAEFQARLEEEAGSKLRVLATDLAQTAAKLKESQEREATVRQEASAETEARVRAEVEERLATVSNDLVQAAAKLKESLEREATVRQEATAETEARVRAEVEERLAQAAAKLKESQEREATVRQEATAETEARVRAEVEERLATVSNDLVQAAAKVKELEDSASQHQQELARQRSVLEQDRNLKLSEQAEHNLREREQLLEKVASLTKQIEQRELGAEFDVFEDLQANFQDDNIRRIGNGAPGADILLTVRHDGQECGSIVVDSKNHQQWRDSFLEQLRKDQIAANAEHAILATRAFPRGVKRDLHIDPKTRIIVASHARVAQIVDILRIYMQKMRQLRLSLEKRAEKRDRLYEYIASEDFGRNMAEAKRLTIELDEVDVEEKKAHDKIWGRRGSITGKLRNSLRHIDSEVSTIITGK